MTLCTDEERKDDDKCAWSLNGWSNGQRVFLPGGRTCLAITSLSHALPASRTVLAELAAEKNSTDYSSRLFCRERWKQAVSTRHFQVAADPLLRVLTVFRPEQWLPATATTFSATFIMQNVYGGMKSVKATDQSRTDGRTRGVSEKDEACHFYFMAPSIRRVPQQNEREGRDTIIR